MSFRRLLRDQRGVTLIDLILVIILVSIAIPPMMALFIQEARGSTLGVHVSRANSLGETLLDEIRSKQWDENGAAASATLGADGVETRAGYDDMDDFNNLDETPPKDSQGNDLTDFAGFRQQVSVCYVANTDLATCVGGTSYYKKITVTITDPEGRTSILETVASSF